MIVAVPPNVDADAIIAAGPSSNGTTPAMTNARPKTRQNVAFVMRRGRT